MKFILRQKGAEDRSCAVEPLGEGRYAIQVDGADFTVESRALGQGGYSLLDERGGSFEAWVHAGAAPAERAVWMHDGSYRFSLLSPTAALLHEAAGATGGMIISPMPGRLVKLLVGVGEAVTAGQPVCVVEAMKMQNELAASAAGTVRVIHYKAGDQLAAGETIVEIT